MEFLSEHASWIAWGALFIVLYVSLSGLKEPKGDYKLIKDCATQRTWKGSLKEAELVSWK